MINRAFDARYRLMLIAAGLVYTGPAHARPPDHSAPLAWSKANVVSLLSLYTHLHQHPELSFHEKETAARIAQEWRNVGFQVTTDIGGHGVVAVMRNGAGPTLMLRTDLDALPVTEQTGLAYASKVRATTDEGLETGAMHACGHDIHMTNLVGVARYLAEHRQLWSGTLLLVGQPAEERAAGARRMIKDGLFKCFPKPDFAVAFHVDSTLETGVVGYRAGYMLANVDSVDVVMRGRGGHGAAPHMTIDPIVQAAELVLDLQTLISREMKPTDPAVVTVGSIHGGSQHNVISDSCRLQITVRCYSTEVRRHLLEGIARKAKAVAAGARAPEPTIEIGPDSLSAVFNDEALTGRCVGALRPLLGEDKLVPSEPVMMGEDFSRYAEAGVPIVMLRLGSVERVRLKALTRGGMQPPSLHSALYYPDPELTLMTGVAAMSSIALDLLKPTARKPVSGVPQ